MFLLYYCLTGLTVYVAKHKELSNPGFYVVVGIIVVLSILL